mgnify:CR=1 FL=1
MPIFKFIEARSGLPFDVCVNNEGGLRNSAAVRRVLQEHPELRPLLLVLKAILQQANLHQTYSGGVGSYLLFSMALPLVGVEGPLTGDEDDACEYVADEEEEEGDEEGEGVQRGGLVLNFARGRTGAGREEEEEEEEKEEDAAHGCGAGGGGAEGQQEEEWLRSVLEDGQEGQEGTMEGRGRREAKLTTNIAVVPKGAARTPGGLGSWKGVRVGRWSDDDDDDDNNNDEGGHGGRGGGRGGERLDAASRLREAVDSAAMSAGRAAREEAQPTTEAAPPVECGDVGGLLRRFLERYSRGTLRIDDPMQGGGGSDIGAKAFRFAEVRTVSVAGMAVRHLPCPLHLLHRLHVLLLLGEPLLTLTLPYPTLPCCR